MNYERLLEGKKVKIKQTLINGLKYELRKAS